ncbi:heparan sulfate 2-O-sulfotransferase 1 [Trichinella spiralis]|uniref:heparan sulfate 2-O-sulfotransferase 1 n=1 Tax=Trichinella spiralis TaxID=6334 RepID=UPI0001EFC7EA|nr:heparan sulfate 2-O-sulfotransferase 1 [Trichinella spiralis]
MLVGVSEELQDFVELLELIFPDFFSGATVIYSQGRKSYLRKTVKKIPPSEQTLAQIRQSPIWKMEQDFYEFAKRQFHFLKLIKTRLGGKREIGYHYEKVKPTYSCLSVFTYMPGSISHYTVLTTVPFVEQCHPVRRFFPSSWYGLIIPCIGLVAFFLVLLCILIHSVYIGAARRSSR